MLKKVILGLCVISWVVLTIFFWNFNSKEDISYGGELVFETQDEYVEFKEDLKDRILGEEIELSEFTVLASEPPIIVKFKVGVPYDYELPWGERDPIHLAEVIFMTVLMSIIAGFILLLLPRLIMYGGKGDE